MVQKEKICTSVIGILYNNRAHICIRVTLKYDYKIKVMFFFIFYQIIAYDIIGRAEAKAPTVHGFVNNFFGPPHKIFLNPPLADVPVIASPTARHGNIIIVRFLRSSRSARRRVGRARFVY